MTNKTIYNGDIVNNTPVITNLCIDDLESGKIHRFIFKGADMPTGQSWYVPVIVAKGIKPGKRMLLNTGIHGDEFNGIKVIQNIFADLDPSTMSGSIIGILQASPSSIMRISRFWYMNTDGETYENMNRVFPGNKDGNTAYYHAYLLWNNLWINNIDYCLDLHTQSTDTDYPLFLYADYSNEVVARMGSLLHADQAVVAMSMPDGTVEGALIAAGIPTATLEIGSGRIFQADYIARAIEGVKNVLIDFKIILGTITHSSNHTPFIGTTIQSVNAKVGGYADILVALNTMIAKDQLIAIQKNAFGDVIQEYYAPIDGIVASVGSGAIRENGALLVRILSK